MLVIKNAACFRVRRQKHLEAAIEQEPVYLVGLDPPAHARRCFQHATRDAGLDELACTAKSCEAPAHDERFLRLHGFSN